jgi:hypothetical protein
VTTVRCDRMPNCVRVLGHAGCCTACPSAATLDWDHDKSPIAQKHIDAAVALWALDFPTPPWADLNDPL